MFVVVESGLMLSDEGLVPIINIPLSPFYSLALAASLIPSSPLILYFP